jgi:hypothetical protein
LQRRDGIAGALQQPRGGDGVEMEDGLKREPSTHLLAIVARVEDAQGHEDLPGTGEIFE